MPFKSEKQKKFLFANKPNLAKRWSKEYNKGAEVKKKPKMVYKKIGTVKGGKPPTTFHFPDLDKLMAKKEKIEEQIKLAKKRRWIKGKPSGVRLTGSGRYVKKGGKV